jgi:cation diffusion facilitator family transporter
VLLSVLAVELALRSFERGPHPVARPGWGLLVMSAVLAVNVCVAAWQAAWARRLDSDLLRADSQHTLSDVLVTTSVIFGWQFAARGQLWLDTATTLAVAALILYLAWGLFRRAVPILVDHSAADPDEIRALVETVAGVRSARRIRSRGRGPEGRLEVVVSVDATLPTWDSHRIADEVERVLEERFEAADVLVHVEPHQKR